MRTAVFTLFGLALLAGSAGAADMSKPEFTLRSQGTETARADYAAMSVGIGAIKLSFGRPASALDDRLFLGSGLSLAQSRSRAGEAAARDQLGAGILVQGAFDMGLSISTSVHEGLEDEENFVAVTGRYVAPDIEPIGIIAVYGGAENNGEADVYRLGSSLTRGVASAGVDFTAEESPSQRRVTGIYVGLDVTETFSFAVSREVERNRDGEELPPRLGLGAAYSIGERQVLSGAIGDMTGDTPTFGLMLGLEF